ncbi:radical S-adenosyl methionine domain-containing protein 1, mitochondrial-like isoform X2 [Halichondria panicea]|uniref:radical S-adenosyl methionine domain-containing protein 1, mitochondrial-like isoform X2 n=1 Tax=Halichondria panicea TaxID=6063 RepID=UPI00312BBD13
MALVVNSRGIPVFKYLFQQESSSVLHQWRSCSNSESRSRSCNRLRRTGTLYVHWPYCAQLCTYCNFNKYKNTHSMDKEHMFSCLVKEFQSVLSRSSVTDFTSIYFGGGTPSLAGPGLVEAVLRAVSEHSQLESGAEVCLEANPSSAKLAQLRDFKLAGVTRLSLGIQSLDDTDLKLMNRDHSSEEGTRALKDAISIFPGSVNTDVIFGRPGQSLQKWKEELSDVNGMVDNHVSLYQLTVEKGTPLAKSVLSGEQSMPNEDTVADMYEHAVQSLEEAGLRRYEVSNFAKEGFESRHNMSYWTGCDYIGIGPGAHSRYFEKASDSYSHYIHTVNALEPKSWAARVLDVGDGVLLRKHLTNNRRLEEVIATCLRTTEGLSNEIWSQFSAEPLQLKIKNMNDDKLTTLLQAKFLNLDSSGLRTTSTGLIVLDTLLPDIVSALGNKRTT